MPSRVTTPGRHKFLPTEKETVPQKRQVTGVTMGSVVVQFHKLVFTIKEKPHVRYRRICRHTRGDADYS